LTYFKVTGQHLQAGWERTTKPTVWTDWNRTWDIRSTKLGVGIRPRLSVPDPARIARCCELSGRQWWSPQALCRWQCDAGWRVWRWCCFWASWPARLLLTTSPS
jgi:hypothetical protein